MIDFTCKRSLQNSERFPVKSAPEKKKPTFTSALATWASELFSIYALSSETCRARDVVDATRSVAWARTADHLATSTHREQGTTVIQGVSNHRFIKDLFRSIQIADTWAKRVRSRERQFQLEIWLRFGRGHGLLRGQRSMSCCSRSWG